MTIEEIKQFFSQLDISREEMKKFSIEQLKKFQFKLRDIEDFLAILDKQVEIYYDKIEEIIEDKETELEEEIFIRDDYEEDDEIFDE